MSQRYTDEFGPNVQNILLQATRVIRGRIPAHGLTENMGRLRGYGNAINAEAAATFIKSYTDGIECHHGNAGECRGCAEEWSDAVTS